MKYLPSDIQFLLDQKSEIEALYNGQVYVKVYHDENYISLYRSDKNDYKRIELELVLIYSIKNKNPLIHFTNDFLPIAKNGAKYYEKLIDDVKELMEYEFQDLSDFISTDISLLDREDLKAKAKEYFLQDEKPTFNFPQIIDCKLLSLNDLIEMAEDSNEFAYNKIEQYISLHPEVIEQYQEMVAINTLMKDCEKTLSTKVLIEKQLSDIANNPSYKSLRVDVELGDGYIIEEKVEKFEKENFYRFYPFYSITKVCHGRQVLYERTFENLEEYQLSETYNLEEVSKLNSRYYSSSNITSYMDCINSKLLDSESFVFELCEISTDYFKKASNRLKDDEGFVTSLLDTNKSFINKLIAIFEGVGSTLQTNIDFCKMLLEKYSLKLYRFFKKEMLIEPSIMNYFTTNCNEQDLEYISSIIILNDLFNDKSIKDLFFKGIKENLEKRKEYFFLPISLLKYIEDEAFALEQVLSVGDYERRFYNLNEKLRFDKNFVEKYINSIKAMLAPESYKFTSTIIYSLSNDELEDIDLMEKILIDYQFSNYLYTRLPSKVLTEDLCSKVCLKTPTNIIYFPEDIQIKEIKKNPIWFQFSSLKKYSSDVADLFFELAKRSPSQILYMQGYSKEIALNFVKLNIESYKYIKSYYLLDPEILDYVKDKIFILNILPDKTKWNASRHPINDKEFVLKQFELVPDDEKPLVLSYIPKATKRIDAFSLLDDKEVVYAALDKDYRNILNLDSKSKFWEDIEVAKKVCVNDIYHFSNFNIKVRKNEDVVKYIYDNIELDEKPIFLELLPKYMQKKF